MVNSAAEWWPVGGGTEVSSLGLCKSLVIARGLSARGNQWALLGNAGQLIEKLLVGREARGE